MPTEHVPPEDVTVVGSFCGVQEMGHTCISEVPHVGWSHVCECGGKWHWGDGVMFMTKPHQETHTVFITGLPDYLQHFGPPESPWK